MTKAVKADFGFETSGDIRVDSIQKGQYTLGDLYEMLPWDNYIMTMKLTGAQVKEILENGVTLKYGIVQASGLKFKYDSSKKAGERVYNITLPNGKPINMKAEYTVAVNDYLQTGGDEYSAFTKGKDVKNSGILERDAVMNYIKALNAKGKSFSASVDGRAVCKSVLENEASQVINGIKKAKTGLTIVVNCVNSKTVSKDIFKALKGKNVNITFMDDYNNINITFNGKNIKKVVNFSLVNAVPNLTARKNICKEVKQNNLTYICFKSTLPGYLTASIELNDSIAASKNVYVYQYNLLTKKIYKVSKPITPSKSGYASFKVNTNMIYFITTKNSSNLSYIKTLKVVA